MQRNARGWTSALEDLNRALSGRPARRGAETDPPERRTRAPRGDRPSSDEARSAQHGTEPGARADRRRRTG